MPGDLKVRRVHYNRNLHSGTGSAVLHSTFDFTSINDLIGPKLPWFPAMHEGSNAKCKVNNYSNKNNADTI